jgi:hypothetical protein
MGVIDDFKQEKNKKSIIIASEKMIKDKYDITIDNGELINIINGIVLSICNDAILIKNVVKLIELNTIALTKIRDYVEIKIVRKTEEVLYHQEIPIEKELINNKYETEELLSKVLELEEKRKTVNSLVNLEQIKETEVPINSNNSIDPNTANTANTANTIFSPYAVINTTSNPTNDNIELVAYIIEKMESIINSKKNIGYKNLIINSYNRDWTIYNDRNNLSLSVNIDLNKNVIEPKKLLMPKYIKNTTPYITMTINDGKKSQKFQFIMGDSSGGHWDTWVIINNERDNLNNIINLNNKDWVITFADFLNTELKLGSDNINISRISRTFEENQYIITIDKRDLILYNEYYLDYLNKYDNILLKTSDDEEVRLKIIEIADNAITVLSDRNILDYTDGTLLNYKAQYTIALTYNSKIAK